MLARGVRITDFAAQAAGPGRDTVKVGCGAVLSANPEDAGARMRRPGPRDAAAW